MVERVEIISLQERDAWEEVHQEGGLPCQSWHYAWGLGATGIVPKLAVVQSGNTRMLVPFFERLWRGHVDIATVLGLSGASLRPPNTSPLRLWHEYASAQDWVAGYIQLDPFSGDPRPEGPDPLGQWVSHNAVFIADLRKEDFLGEASRTIRRKVAEGERSGARLCTDQASLAARLEVLYPLAMERFGNPSHYCFPKRTLERWSTDPAAFLVGAEQEGQIESVWHYFTAGEYAEGLITASTEQGRRLGPWAIFHSFHLLRARGVFTVNVGGGVRPHDNLYRYKEWWGWRPMPLVGLCQIYDPERYRALCEEAEMGETNDYFPAYRRRQD